MADLPEHARYVILGAGIHGLSTSMHLAQKLRAKGITVGAGGRRIVFVDELPTNPSGKVLKRELLAAYARPRNDPSSS